MLPSSIPKTLLPAYPSTGKFEPRETKRVTHIFHDNEIIVPGIMSSSPIKRNNLTCCSPDSIPESPCSHSSSQQLDELSSPVQFKRDKLNLSEEEEESLPEKRLDLNSILTKEVRSALCILPIVTLIRPNTTRISRLMAEKRIMLNKDLQAKSYNEEFLAIISEYYPPIAIGRSSLLSQVVLSKVNRQISRRHITTWYDFSRHVIVIVCLGWNGCRVMSRDAVVIRTIENKKLLKQIKKEHGDIFEDSFENGKKGIENQSNSSQPVGTFLLKNDRIETESSEVLIDVRGERFLIRLVDENEHESDEERSSCITDDETFALLSSVSASTYDKEDNRSCEGRSRRDKIRGRSEFVEKSNSEIKDLNAENKKIKTFESEIKPYESEIRPLDSEIKPLDSEIKGSYFEKGIIKTDKLMKNNKKAGSSFDESHEMDSNSNIESKQCTATYEPKVKSVKSTDLCESMSLQNGTKNCASPLLSPISYKSSFNYLNPDLPLKDKKSKLQPNSKDSTFQMTTDVDFENIRNFVCNHLAFSRLNSTPLSTIMSISPKISNIPKDQLQRLLMSIECIGIIYRDGKDAAGKVLEEEYYYIPDQDPDEARRQLVNETKGGIGLRNCRKVHKQYYWKKPTF